MAAASPPPQPSLAAKPSNRKGKRKRTPQDTVIDRIDSLRWKRSLPEDDPFSVLDGSNELEGGFYSLEEIDESEYGLVIPKLEEGKPERKTKSRKWKHDDAGDGIDEKVEVEKNVDIKKKRKKKKKKEKSKAHETQKNEESTAVSNSKEDVEGESINEAEFFAWNELRLHPLLMKSIYSVGFKEPTPIQKASIPAAAHEGKRLLLERDKATKMFAEMGEEAEKFGSKGVLCALIITPTKELALQVSDHLKQVAEGINIRVVPIVGGMSTEKQERLLKARPEIVVGTPGRLWELMSGGEKLVVELHSLSFFVLDEADRMIENGHFRELQSIINMLPITSSSVGGQSHNTQSCVTFSSLQRKKRQTFVFPATIALSTDFRKKLKRGSLKSNHSVADGINGIETLFERAGMKPNAAIIDLTKASILADKLEESFVECTKEDKDAHLYYMLSVHGQG